MELLGETLDGRPYRAILVDGSNPYIYNPRYVQRDVRVGYGENVGICLIEIGRCSWRVCHCRILFVRCEEKDFYC